MAAESPKRPRLRKGELVAYDQPILGPVPNRIVFQYNPEQLTRTLQPRLAHPQPKGTTAARNDAVLTAGFPSESISLAIELDATDQLELRDPIAMSVGVQPALAALELLMYPKSKDVRLNEQEAGKGKASLKREDTPVVLFYWSEARVVPVRVSSLSITEQAFDPALNPIRARVDLGLQVLSSIDLPKPSLGRNHYNAMLAERERLAELNIANRLPT
jgi:Contractile injection system tube protein